VHCLSIVYLRYCCLQILVVQFTNVVEGVWIYCLCSIQVVYNIWTMFVYHIELSRDCLDIVYISYAYVYTLARYRLEFVYNLVTNC